MDEHVPKSVVQRRFERLLAAQERISRERNEELVGQTVELTIEQTCSKKDPDRATGRTRTNKLVHLASNGYRPGAVVSARVTGAEMHYLLGQPT